MNPKINIITCIINSIRPLNVDLQQFIEEMQTVQNVSTTVVYTECQGHAVEIARNASNQRCDLIMAIGGDGTFNEVINGILNSQYQNTPVCLIPNGTGNDFCRAQDINFDKNAICEALKNPVYKSYDVGLVSQGQQKKYFLNVMDAGFGGYATMLLDQQRSKGIHGGLSYSIAILRAFIKFRKPRVEIKIDNKAYYSGKIMMIAVSNGRSFGNGLIIYPDSKPDDGLLGVTTLGNVTIIDYLINLSNLRKGKYIQNTDIFYTTCKDISLRIINGNAPVELDGEVLGSGDAEISVVSGILNVLKY